MPLFCEGTQRVVLSQNCTSFHSPHTRFVCFIVIVLISLCFTVCYLAVVSVWREPLRLRSVIVITRERVWHKRECGTRESVARERVWHERECGTRECSTRESVARERVWRERVWRERVWHERECSTRESVARERVARERVWHERE